MALQTSGQISLNDVNVELGNSGTSQIDMNSSAVRGLLERPSGQISLSDGYGKSSVFVFTISSNTQEANLSTLATAAGWDGSAEVEATVASGVYLWSDSTSTAGLIVNIAGVTVTNNGKIIGKGGYGAYRVGTSHSFTSGAAGGPALSVTSSGVTIINNSGAYIAGGGGGGGGFGDGGESDYAAGGGGAGGGNGGYWVTNGSPYSGGAIGQVGSDAGFYQSGVGGGAGGGGGAVYGNGGGGGRILPGTGGAAGAGSTNYGNGGAAGNTGQAGASHAHFGGGGGGWGAAGGNSQTSRGSGGAAITNTTSYTLSNSGTIYGAT